MIFFLVMVRSIVGILRDRLELFLDLVSHLAYRFIFYFLGVQSQEERQSFTLFERMTDLLAELRKAIRY